MHSARDQLLLLAARQGGWVAPTQARLLGVDRATVGRMVSAGVLVREDRLYRTVEPALEPDSRLWAAVLRSGGALSHRTAAQRFGAELASRQIEVLVEYRRAPARIAGVIVHRTRNLSGSDIEEPSHGPPLTRPPRTFVDLCGLGSRISDVQIAEALDAWFAAGHATATWLAWFVEGPAAGLEGRPRAARILGAYERADSSAERRLVRLLTGAELPPFSYQYEIRHSGRLLGRVDVAWPDRHVALELDGYRYHSGPGVFAADRQRANEIQLAGWTLLRTTPAEVDRSPERLTVTVRQALELAGAQPRVGRRGASRAS